MNQLWAGICIGLSALLLPGGSLILLAWLLRGDGFRYSIRCGTCGARSGEYRYRWSATRWANKHSKKSQVCSKRIMTGNRKQMQ